MQQWMSTTKGKSVLQSLPAMTNQKRTSIVSGLVAGDSACHMHLPGSSRRSHYPSHAPSVGPVKTWAHQGNYTFIGKRFNAIRSQPQETLPPNTCWNLGSQEVLWNESQSPSEVIQCHLCFDKKKKLKCMNWVWEEGNGIGNVIAGGGIVAKYIVKWLHANHMLLSWVSPITIAIVYW